MACKCKTIARNADGEAFPTVVTQYNLDNPSEQTCCTKETSCPSEGSVVPTNLMDTCCGNEGVTLLARIGNKLTRFTKDGYIQLRKGKAYVVDSFNTKVSELYHKRFRSFGQALPVLGVPLDSHYDVIADETGKTFGQKGLDGEDSLRMWNQELDRFQTTAVSELPKTHKGLLPYEEELELVGFEPIPANGSNTDVRNLSVLSGEGIIVFKKQTTIASECDCDGCQPVEAKASVASFLANPTGTGIYTLKFSVDDGHYWDED